MGVHINGGSRGVEQARQLAQTSADTNAPKSFGERARAKLPAALAGLVARRETAGGTDAPTLDRRRMLRGAAGVAGGMLAAACSSNAPAPTATPTPASSAEQEAAITQLLTTATAETRAILSLPRPTAAGPAQEYDNLYALARQPTSMTDLVNALNLYRSAVATAHLVEPKEVHNLRLARDRAQIALFQATGQAVEPARINMQIDERLPYRN